MDVLTAACCLVAFLLYYNTLNAGFVYDDRRAILTNPDLLPTTPWSTLLTNDFWGTSITDAGSHGSYRPLCVLTFRLNYLLHGFFPWGYHLVNVILHVTATALVVQVARVIFPKPSRIAPTVCGLLFATHPIHTEAVAGVVGRADLAACNFFLGAFLFYVAHVRLRDAARTRLDARFFCARHRIDVDCRECSDQARGRVAKDTGHQCHVEPVKTEKKYHLLININRDICRLETFLFSPWSLISNVSLSVKQSERYANSSASYCQCKWDRPAITEKVTLLSCVVMAICALLSKETGVTVILVCVAYDLVQSSFRVTGKKQLQSIAIMIIVFTALVAWRIALSRGHTPTFSTADNPTAKSHSFVTRMLTFAYLPAFNVYLLLNPATLSFDWSMDAIPRVHSLFDARNAISIILYCAVLGAIRRAVNHFDNKRARFKRATNRKTRDKCACRAAHTVHCKSANNNNVVDAASCVCADRRVKSKCATSRKSARVTLLSLSFFVLPFLPATNLFFYVGFVVAERILYLPSIGFCLLIGHGAEIVWRKFARGNASIARGFYASVAFVVLVFSARTYSRNVEWWDEESLYRSAIPINPAKAYGNLGSILNSQNRIDEAEFAYRKALEHRANMADVHFNLGILLQSQDKYHEAILSYQKAIHYRPSLAVAYLNLGSALVALGRCQEAIKVLRQCAQLDGSGVKDARAHESARTSALVQLGALYADKGDLELALGTYHDALKTMPRYYSPHSIYNLLGETLTRLKQFAEAEQWYQAALQAQPDHVPAHITYGKLLARNSSRVAEAEQWFRRAQKLAPTDPSVHHHYGEFLASMHRFNEAARHYVRAAQIHPNDYELVVAAATALRQAELYRDAEVWYKQAAILNPKDAKTHTNLGAILHMNGKFQAAAASYREALRLQPEDLTTLTNLHKLYSAMASQNA